MNEIDQIERLINEANKLGVENILNTPTELERELSAISAAILPEYEIAKQVTQKMIEMKSRGQST